MRKYDALDNREFIFGALLMIANRIDTLLEREMNPLGMTSKQWFLCMILMSLFEKPPTIKEVARAMGTSHQNVKQVALKLENKGFAVLEKDDRDSRATRIRLTDRCREFWLTTQHKGAEFFKAAFKALDDNNLNIVRIVMEKILSNLVELENAKLQQEL